MLSMLRGWIVGPLILLAVVAYQFRADLARVGEATLLVHDLLPGMEERRLDWVRDRPESRDTSFDVAGQTYAAREIGDGAPLVLLPGADQEGAAHPLFVAFARTLAQAGFRVFVPDVPGLRRLELRAADARIVAAAVRHLAEETGRRPGIAAISFGVGPALLAALEEDPAYVLGIGGYHDSEALIAFLTTGFHRPPGEGWRHRDPAPYAVRAFLKANAQLLPDPSDRQVLAAFAGRQIGEDAAYQRLGPGGRAVLDLLRVKEPEQVAGRIAALPGPIRSEIAALSLAGRDFSSLNGRVYLVHGRDDPLIPASESVALAASLGEESADLTVLHSLSHVTFDAVGAMDGLRLWRVAYLLLTERDRVPPPATSPNPSTPSG